MSNNNKRRVQKSTGKKSKKKTTIKNNPTRKKKRLRAANEQGTDPAEAAEIASPPELIFEAHRTGSSTFANVTAYVDGQPVISKRMNLGDPDARDELVDEMANVHPAIDRADAQKQLLTRAAMVTKQPAGNKQGTQASKLVELTDGACLFHDADGEAYARFTVGNGDGAHREVARVRSKHFKQWLRSECYKSTQRKVASTQLMQEALDAIEAKAVFDGELRPVFTRLAEYNGKIYLDLCNDGWQVVEVDETGWRILDNSPVMFRRAKAMHPLPTPLLGGAIDELRSFVNVGDEDWPLLVGWLVGALRPQGPYPVLGVLGEQGSAKSTLCRYVRMIIDPNKANLRGEYREPRDLMIAASNGQIIALDNVSYLSPWLSDCLCRLSTGGGFSTRTLFEDTEETIFDATRPLILNAIEEVADRSDLLDRMLLLNLPRIEERSRRAERQLNREFEEACPRILGALLTAVATALRNVSDVHLSVLPRMADFAIWVTAAESALGLQPGEFLAAYAANRLVGHQTAIEATTIGRILMDFLQSARSTWTGTATDLLVVLSSCVGESTTRRKGWPGSARALGGILRRIAPNLRQLGYSVEFDREGGERTRTITLAAPATPIVATRVEQRAVVNGVRVRVRPRSSLAEPA